MKTLEKLALEATKKKRFQEIEDYTDFCKRFLEFLETGLQGKNAEIREIVPKNEENYRFFQYRESEIIMRPVNMDLFLSFSDYSGSVEPFLRALRNAREIRDDAQERQLLNRFIYTTQQAIGCALDALPDKEDKKDKNQKAKKIHGELFEQLMRLVIKELGIKCRSSVEKVKIPESGESMTFQHDIQILDGGRITAVGSVKTSSKDRVDKIFLDKLMYNHLTDTKTPHFAIFLNDVQRRKSKVAQTFLTGHFKAYTSILRPLDGVYYCDLRPVMRSDPRLKDIRSLDCLLCEDIWGLTKMPANK